MTSARTLVLAAASLIIVMAAAYLILDLEKEASQAIPLPDTLKQVITTTPPTLKVSLSGVEEGRIAKTHTCDGSNTPPKIKAGNIPSNAKGVAVVVYDPDAPRGTFIHWVVFAESLDEINRGGGVSGLNSYGTEGYRGPCPPLGDRPHRYFFLVMALDKLPQLKEGYKLRELAEALRGSIMAWGYSVALYSR